jgi:hypothetical protein
MDSFQKAFGDFVKVFTLKRVIVMLVVAVALLLVLAPRHPEDAPPTDKLACDGSCPLHPDVINVPLQTMISQENWTLTLVGDGWEAEEPSIPVMKLVQRNLEKECMVLLIKEPTELTFAQYVIESLRGFSEGGARVVGVKQVTLNQQKFILMEARLSDGDALMAWNGIKDGFGYSLSCFWHPSADAGVNQYEFCKEIANSLEIK